MAIRRAAVPSISPSPEPQTANADASAAVRLLLGTTVLRSRRRLIDSFPSPPLGQTDNPGAQGWTLVLHITFKASGAITATPARVASYRSGFQI